MGVEAETSSNWSISVYRELLDDVFGGDPTPDANCSCF
jgi:hypothetical protein